jgi:hypothetical protein
MYPFGPSTSVGSLNDDCSFVKCAKRGRMLWDPETTIVVSYCSFVLPMIIPGGPEVQTTHT